MDTIDEKIKALISAAQTIATNEGITEEDLLAVRIGDIIKDAQLDEPLTPAGQAAKSRAEEIIAVNATAKAGGMASPYQEQKFDYDARRDATAIAAVTDIFKIIAAHSEFLPIPTKTTPEYEKSCEDAYNASVLEIFESLEKNSVGMNDYKYVFDSLKTVISALDEQIMQQIVGHRHEIMSRILEKKNPGTQKFDSNYATYGDLKTGLEKVRNETGNKPEDYFTMKNEGDMS